MSGAFGLGAPSAAATTASTTTPSSTDAGRGENYFLNPQLDALIHDP
jgi:hypothetical protein